MDVQRDHLREYCTYEQCPDFLMKLIGTALPFGSYKPEGKSMAIYSVMLWYDIFLVKAKLPCQPPLIWPHLSRQGLVMIICMHGQGKCNGLEHKEDFFL